MPSAAVKAAMQKAAERAARVVGNQPAGKTKNGRSPLEMMLQPLPSKTSTPSRKAGNLERGVSTASTVPADDNLARSLVVADMQSLKTPSPREKAPAEVVSAPKTTKKEEVHVTRSPTQYYSPSKGERSKNGKKVPKVPEAKTTAVKRSAKPPKKTIDKKTPTQTDDQQKEPKTIDKKKKNQTEDQQDTTPPKQETVPTAIAVHATLQRAATVDINSGPPPPSPGGSDNDESGSASDSDGGGDQNEDNDDQEGPEGPGEDGLTAEHVRQKKLAHARYMLFSRSLQSRRCPIEIKRAGKAAFRCSERISILYEQWIECAGHWSESSLLQQLRYEKRHRRIGARKWLTYAELVIKYGNSDCARKICESKRRDPEVAKEQIRPHPDCPGDREMDQYLVWDQDSEEDQEDHVTSTLFEAVDREKSRERKKESKPKDSKKKKKKTSKKGKKRGRASSSDSSSKPSTDSSDDASSSSSEDKKKKKKSKQNGKKSGKKNSKTNGKKDKKDKSKKDKDNKDKKKKKKDSESSSASETEETPEEKAKREQKDLEKKAKEVKSKRIAKANKAVNKLQSSLAKVSLVEIKASSMSANLKNVFLQELAPQKHNLSKAREDLQKAVDAAKGGGDLALLDAPEESAEIAVKEFTEFLTSNNMK
ncbi:unnamed protein product [Cladocopium goreaui]|uniref:Uncharacterized protein n=1 Tax=Cladocopium goreaui TaxID=2562237 RepID=A0A9P1BJN3_9DINO|nr:unnamed protein product [Cladocopium goreaui]